MPDKGAAGQRGGHKGQQEEPAGGTAMNTQVGWAFYNYA